MNVLRTPQEEWIFGNGMFETFESWDMIDENVDQLMQHEGTIGGPIGFIRVNCGKSMWEIGSRGLMRQLGSNRGGYFV